MSKCEDCCYYHIEKEREVYGSTYEVRISYTCLVLEGEYCTGISLETYEDVVEATDRKGKGCPCFEEEK